MRSWAFSSILRCTMATLYSWSTEIGSRSKGGRRVGKKTRNTWSIYSNTDIERVATRGRPVSSRSTYCRKLFLVRHLHFFVTTEEEENQRRKKKNNSNRQFAPSFFFFFLGSSTFFLWNCEQNEGSWISQDQICPAPLADGGVNQPVQS